MIYVCKACGHLLYVFESVGQDFIGPRAPSEVRLMYAGRCPKCGHVLGIPDLDDVTIRPRGISTGTALVQQPTYTSANVSRDLANRLKAYTEEKGLTISEVVQKALEDYLKARGWL